LTRRSRPITTPRTAAPPASPQHLLRVGDVDPIGQIGGLLDEFQWAGKVERVIDRVQVIEVRRLGELDKRQPMPGMIRVQEVAGEGQELAAVRGVPVVVECVEFLQPLARPGGGKGGGAGGQADLAAAQLAGDVHHLRQV